MKQIYLAAVDIGGTKITASISDKKGILCKVYQLTKKKGNNKTIPNQVDRLIQHCCNNINLKKSQISAVGISSCGPFQKKGKYYVIVAPNLCGGISKGAPNSWKSIELEQELSKKYKKVVLGNDGITSAKAEKLFGSAKKYENFIYITWSTGIGAGAYADGKLLSGKNGNASHIGHIYISQDGPRCGCGQNGDLESLASGTAISKSYNNLHVKEIFGLYKKGDKKAKRIIQIAAKNFARGLVSINSLLDTQLFIIGGSLMKNKKILLPLVKKEFYKGFKPLTKNVKIIPSNLGFAINDLAGLSLVMPDDWVRSWQKRQPWKSVKEIIL